MRSGTVQGPPQQCRQACRQGWCARLSGRMQAASKDGQPGRQSTYRLLLARPPRAPLLGRLRGWRRLGLSLGHSHGLAARPGGAPRAQARALLVTDVLRLLLVARGACSGQPRRCRGGGTCLEAATQLPCAVHAPPPPASLYTGAQCMPIAAPVHWHALHLHATAAPVHRHTCTQDTPCRHRHMHTAGAVQAAARHPPPTPAPASASSLPTPPSSSEASTPTTSSSSVVGTSISASASASESSQKASSTLISRCSHTGSGGGGVNSDAAEYRQPGRGRRVQAVRATPSAPPKSVGSGRRLSAAAPAPACRAPCGA